MNECPTQMLPPAKIMAILGEYAGLIKNPALKLKLINRVMEKYTNESKFHYRLIPHFDEIIVRRLIQGEIKRLFPEDRVLHENALKHGRFTVYKRMLWHFYPYRLPAFTLFAVFTFCLTFWGVSTVASYIPEAPPQKNSAVFVQSIDYQPQETDSHREPIWLVEESKGLEVYSNRLRIITTDTVKNVPRLYLPFPTALSTLPDKKSMSGKIAGILYHSSESDILPLSEKLNNSIKKSSLNLLKYIKRIKSYNYLIDRYGRVYRVVEEDQAAFHAGNSIWADGDTIYLNLNHAFIGICFEGRDFEPQVYGLTAKAHSSINEVQVKSARELTDWLRFKYKIDEKNCVTHGLTSINPRKKLIGYHMDLAKGFPFSKMGLKDKYLVPVPSIALFGFSYDDYYLSVFNNQLCRGITLALKDVRDKAKLNGMSEDRYRWILNSRFSVLNKWQWAIENKSMETGKNAVEKQAALNPAAARETRKMLAREFIGLTRYK